MIERVMTKSCCPGCFFHLFSLNPLRIHKLAIVINFVQSGVLLLTLQLLFGYHQLPHSSGSIVLSRAAKGSTCKLSLCTQSHQPTEEFLGAHGSKQQTWMGFSNGKDKSPTDPKGALKRVQAECGLVSDWKSSSWRMSRMSISGNIMQYLSNLIMIVEVIEHGTCDSGPEEKHTG